MKLTKAAVARLPAPDPSGKQTLHWDDELRGFGVLCSGVTDARSFVVQRGVNGRKRRLTVATFAELDAIGKTVEDVRAEAAELLVSMRRGEDPRSKRRGERTLEQWRDEYLAARPNLAARTRRTYKDALSAFAPWFDRPLAELTPEDLERAYRGVKAEVGKRAAKRRKKSRSDLFVSEPGAAGANTALRVLRSVWKFAYARDPERVKPWPAERMTGQWYAVGRRERHVRAEDLPKFWAAVNAKGADGEYAIGRLMRDYVLLLLFTGMRRGEAASLRWRDVDLAARVIRVSAFATKSRRPLALPMSAPVLELLAARRELGVEGEFVFPGPGKKRGHLQEPKKAFAAISDAAGFQVNPHSLRATFLTVAQDVPMTPMALKALVNHALGNDVTAGYVQLTTETLRKPAQDVGQRIAELCGVPAPKKRKGAKPR